MKTIAKYKEDLVVGILLFMVVGVASLPAFRNGIYNGFDLWFHMGRIESIANELANGQFPVRYETTSWYGNGYISTTMYGNILLYFPAILHLLGVAIYRCYNIYVIMINILGVVISIYSFTRIYKDKTWGLVATISYILAGYYISNIYMRAAVGEYTATVFMPLIVYGLYRILYEELDQNIVEKVLPLVIGATGVLESHILTTYMVVMMVSIFLLIFIKDTWRHIKDLVVAFALIIGINAFFLVPFVDAYVSHVFRVSQNTVGVNIQKYGLYIDQIFGLFPEGSGGRAEWSSKGEECSRLGILQVFLFIAVVVLIIFFKRCAKDSVNKNSYKRIIVVFYIGLFSAWLSSAFFPWGIFSGNNVISNIMRSIQYPGRYMVIQTVAWTLCGVYSIKSFAEAVSEQKSRIASFGIITLLMLLALIQNGIFMYTLSCRNLTVQSIEGHESIADDLYLLSDTDMENVETKVSILNGVKCIVEDLGYNKDQREIFIDNKSNEEAIITIPVFCYKYIQARSLAGNVYAIKATDNGQCQVVVEPGFSDTIIISFVEPYSWRIAEMVSAIFIVFLILNCIKGKKRNI